MKIITTLLALSFIACVKPMPPKAETLDLPCSEPALAKPEIVCDMHKVMNVVTDVCCASVACSSQGYRHDLHVMCAMYVAHENQCTDLDMKLNTTSSICDCDPELLLNENP